MRRKRFTEERTAFALRQAEAGTPVEEVCRKMGVSEPSSYRWKRRFAGMGVPEIGGGGDSRRRTASSSSSSPT
jgi:putative transposase